MKKNLLISLVFLCLLGCTQYEGKKVTITALGVNGEVSKVWTNCTSKMEGTDMITFLNSEGKKVSVQGHYTIEEE